MALIASACGIAVMAAWPARAGPPFRTDDPEPVDYQHFEFELFSQATETRGGWSGFIPALEANYGALPNLQLHAIIPLGYTAPTDGSAGFAPGDIELGAKYRFITPGDDDWFPQVATFPLVELPAGNQKLGFSTGHAQFYLPLWLQKDVDPWTIYGGGGYWIGPGYGNRNYGFAGAALWRKMTDRLQLGIEVFKQTSSAIGSPASVGFNLGTTYDFSDNWHLLASAGRGLQNGSATDLFSCYLALQLTF